VFCSLLCDFSFNSRSKSCTRVIVVQSCHMAKMDELPVDSNKQDNGIWLSYKELSVQERNTDLSEGPYKLELLSSVSIEFTELYSQVLVLLLPYLTDPIFKSRVLIQLSCWFCGLLQSIWAYCDAILCNSLLTKRIFRNSLI
jgi:hypothetical protein